MSNRYTDGDMSGDNAVTPKANGYGAGTHSDGYNNADKLSGGPFKDDHMVLNDASPGSKTIDIDDKYDVMSPRAQAALDDATFVIRRSTWVHTFFLVIADILAPTSSPYAISTLGYIPGSILYFGFGVIAVYGGILLWELFMELDSPEVPVRTYGDLAQRICAHWGPRWAFNIKLALAGFQSLELLLAIAAQILGNASGLQEIVVGGNAGAASTCFLLYSMAFPILGCLLSQIKLLNNVSKFAFTNLFMLLILVGITLAIAAIYSPLLGTTGPIPPGGLFSLGYVNPGDPITAYNAAPYPFIISVSGLMNLSYAYAGSLMFVVC